MTKGSFAALLLSMLFIELATILKIKFYTILHRQNREIPNTIIFLNNKLIKCNQRAVNFRTLVECIGNYSSINSKYRIQLYDLLTLTFCFVACILINIRFASVICMLYIHSLALLLHKPKSV